MSDEKLIEEFLQQAAVSRATGKPPALADVAVARLIGIVGQNSPLKPQAIEALAKVDWPLAVNFLSALTPLGMVFVPAGEFTMGSDEDAAEQPPHTVWLDSFYIDKTPVSNAQFALFWEDVAYDQTSDVWGEFDAARDEIYRSLRRAPYYWFDEDFNSPTCPVVGVNWYEAVVYARW
ncbi:MAG: SUMF1/EgtB/PvdO family nonheme iron enzyme, partial [Chloroflexota bacterium]